MRYESSPPEHDSFIPSSPDGITGVMKPLYPHHVDRQVRVPPNGAHHTV
jgi:hypothetical protein